MLPRPLLIPDRTSPASQIPCKSTKSRLPDAEITKGHCLLLCHLLLARSLSETNEIEIKKEQGMQLGMEVITKGKSQPKKAAAVLGVMQKDVVQPVSALPIRQAIAAKRWLGYNLDMEICRRLDNLPCQSHLRK